MGYRPPSPKQVLALAVGRMMLAKGETGIGKYTIKMVKGKPIVIPKKYR